MYMKGVRMPHLSETIQTLIDAFYPLVDSFGHTALSLSLLWETIPPKKRHEETHLCAHRLVRETAGNSLYNIAYII